MSFDQFDNLASPLDPTNIDDELWSLAASAATGTIDDQARAALDKRLGEDDQAVAFYVAYMRMHAQLSWLKRSEKATESDQPLAEQTHPAPRSKSWLDRASRHPKVPAIAVAIAVMVTMLAAMAITPMGDWIAGGEKNPEERQPQGPTVSQYVAILNSWQNDQWLEGSRPPLDDPRLRVGSRLVLKSGLIEVTYHTGARVVIEGPAEFVVGMGTGEDLGQHSLGGKPADDDARFVLPPLHNSGYLAHGKLVARVEGEEAKGFVVATPTAQVEDLGTEFAVEVERSGVSSVFVYSGEIRVRLENETERVLTQGQAAFASRTSIADADASVSHSHFVRRILPTKVDLAQVVAGRSGTTDLPAPQRDTVPFFEEQQFSKTAVNRYSAVRSNPLVDGVFVPDGGAAAEMVVSTTGIKVRGVADSTGASYDFIRSGPNYKVLDVTLDGYDYLTGGRSFIGMHANKGITFDLKAIRRMLPETRIERFVARAGNARGSVDYFVALDGEIVFESRAHAGSDKGIPVEINITDDARFLTLITTDAGDGDGMDWSVFVEPQLRLEPKPDTETKKEEQPTEM